MANPIIISLNPAQQNNSFISASMTERTNQLVYSIAEELNGLALETIDEEWVREVWDLQVFFPGFSISKLFQSLFNKI